MNLIKRYNQIMGPKEERLEAEENKSMKVGGTILLIESDGLPCCANCVCKLLLREPRIYARLLHALVLAVFQ